MVFAWQLKVQLVALFWPCVSVVCFDISATISSRTFNSWYLRPQIWKKLVGLTVLGSAVRDSISPCVRTFTSFISAVTLESCLLGIWNLCMYSLQQITNMLAVLFQIIPLFRRMHLSQIGMHIPVCKVSHNLFKLWPWYVGSN